MLIIRDKIMKENNPLLLLGTTQTSIGRNIGTQSTKMFVVKRMWFFFFFNERKDLLSPISSYTYCFMLLEYSKNDNSL